jgi:hypothetical protein
MPRPFPAPICLEPTKQRDQPPLFSRNTLTPIPRNNVTRYINAAGSALVYSTYLGGSGYDVGTGIAVDAAGNAYVTGETTSPDFPLAGSPLQPRYGGGYSDVFVAKLDPEGRALLYATYLGGSGDDSPRYGNDSPEIGPLLQPG